MGIFSTAGLFLAVLLCNGIFLQSCLGSGSIPAITCIEQERQALLKFKRSLNDTTRRLSSWTGEDCCNWKGIQCDGNTSHVLKLELGGLESLDPFFAPTIEANEVNPSLLELKYLEHLDLSGNNFHNIPIPIFLGSMTSLRYLYLSNSNFGGRVPHHLGNVSNLMVLDLNCIEDTLFSDFPSLTIDDFTWVSRLSSLQYLDASGMDLSRALNLNVMLNMLPSLTELRLSSCGLHSTLLVSHFYLNSTASNIRKLYLSWNSFAGKFPKFIENLTALRVLDLSVNDLKSSFPPYLENLTALRDLDLSDNNLNSSFPLYLENLKSLEHLNLARNSFTAVGLLRLLLTQCTLKSLDMSLNQFKGQMSRSYGNLSGCTMYNLERLILRSNSILGNLPDWLGQFKRLKYLDLSENSFSGSIPQSLGTLSALEELRIYANQLNGTIPVSLGQLSSLKRLNIGVNQLTGTIPLSLGQLSNLTSLDLSYNHLDGVLTEANFANLTILEELRIHSNLLTLKVKSDWMPPFQVTSLQMGSCKIGTSFPQWLRTQKKVSSLDISNASISGTLPQWLDEMPLGCLDLSHNLIGGPIQKLPSTLWKLDLSDNLISGSIQKLPPTLGELDLSDNLISGPLPQNISEMVPSLETLLLAGNLISGLIPYSLWEIPPLQVLDLSRNKLFGNLPRYKGWGALSPVLQVMRLSSNKLSGILPSSIGNFTSLKWLHLNNNSFYGELPSTLRNCTSLKVLDLGENRFSGSIPTWGALSSLYIMRLSSNKLSGILPSSIGNFTSLGWLQLNNNSFYGELPSTLRNCTPQLLKYLDLSYNSFSGSIPQSLGTLSALEVLRISVNQLNGTIPVSLGQLSSLKILDIGHNQLTGTIPLSLGQLSNLKILDLSSNHLEGVLTEANFANLTILEELSIDSNLLTLKVISDWIPPFQVKSLRMGSCKIGTGFPQWLRTQKKVSLLDISNASISGILPQWLDEMPLVTLDLSHNSISGPLPHNISEMVPSLDTLLLAGNLISGLIPYSLWEIPALRVLDLSKNKLSGNLPRHKVWGALSSLLVMRLSSNKLSGILPSSIGNFTYLEWLHLNNNSFYGELPSALRNCTSLIVLDLGENRFSGSIPTWIGDLWNLQVLRLHKNMFIDNTPSQLCHMRGLQIMDFGNNLLTGPIPRCLGNLSGMILDENEFHGFEGLWFDTSMMQVIKGRELEFTSWTFIFLANMDLSGNNLVGSIPKEITNLSGLRGLNLSNNNLTGKIPEKIGGLKLLESLDFSKNQLSGIIPQSISGLNFLSLLNLSYNNLSGRIPTGNQLQTLPSSSYLGNSELCGDPLPRKCRGDEKSQPPTATGHREEHEEDDSEKVWLYVAIMSGYATGLWGFVGVLLLKKSWRHAYFQFVVMVKDEVLLGIALGVARLKNYIDQFGAWLKTKICGPSSTR